MRYASMTWLDPSPLIAQALQSMEGTVREHRIWPAPQKGVRKERDPNRDRARWKEYYWRNKDLIAERRKAAYPARRRRRA